MNALDDLRSVAGWNAFDGLRSAVADYHRAEIELAAHPGDEMVQANLEIAKDAILKEHMDQDAGVIVNHDGAWVTDLKNGREVALWIEIDLELNKTNLARLKAWLESRGASRIFDQLVKEDWQALKPADFVPGRLRDHPFEIREDLQREVLGANANWDPLPDVPFEVEISKIEIRRSPLAKDAGVRRQGALNDLRAAADCYEHAQKAPATCSDELRMARDAIISAMNRLSLEGFLPTHEEDGLCFYEPGDGRQITTRAVIPEKPNKKYRAEGKKWLLDRGITQLDRLGDEVVMAVAAEDPTLPSHEFGMFKWEVIIRRKA